MTNKIVFYIDDDFGNLKALKRLFHGEPIDVILYNSPKDALEKIDEIKPAVVISDQRMPEMKGTVFLGEVRNRLPDTARILVTGYEDIEVAISAINHGNIFRYIRKPWNETELKEAVKSALDYQESVFFLRNMVDNLVDEIIETQKDREIIQKYSMQIVAELNQPLMIINEYIQLLRTSIDRDEDVSNSYLSNIVLQVNRIGELARKIESMSLKH